MSSVSSWRRSTFDEVFGIDLRTLALFRVALASLLIFYVFNRLPDIAAFYTDWGVLPRGHLIQSDSWARFSLYFINGDYWYAALLLLVTAFCGVCLWLGYRTRLMAVCLFVLFVSLANRNPLILIGGDGVLLCLLFWAMFLPLGARWSVDAAFSTRPAPEKNLHCSIASAGMLLQVLYVYFFSAWLKNGADWWPDGLAVYYTMELERYASPLGHSVLGAYPQIMRALTYFVYFLEWLGPVLAFSPFFQRPLRFLVMACLMSMHCGFLLFMEIGYFPFVSLTSLTLLLGGWFWDWRAGRNERAHPVGPKIYYDRDCGFCRGSCLWLKEFLILPRAEIAPAQNFQRAKALLEANYSWVVIDSEDRAHIKWRALVALLRPSPLFGWLWYVARWSGFERIGDAVYDFVGRHRPGFGRLTASLMKPREVRFEVGRKAQGVAAFFLVFVLAWNLVTVNVLPNGFMLVTSPLFRLVRLDQMWSMFAPVPSHRDGWAVYPGKMEDGTDVDVLKPGQPLSWDKPRYLSKEFGNIAWHTLRYRLTDKEREGDRLYYGKYLCRQWNWNAAKGKHLATFEMDYVDEMTAPPGGTPTVERRVIWKHDCRPQDIDKEKEELKNKQEHPMAIERN